MLQSTRTAFARRLAARFWLRFHATLIVAGTFAAGFVASLVLLHLGLEALVPRWLLAIAIAYAVFFGLVRLWLAYVGVHRLRGGDPGGIDFDLPDATARVRIPDLPFRGQGGGFAGAGASSEFSVATPAMQQAADGTQGLVHTLSSPSAHAGGSVADAAGKSVGDAIGIDGDGFLILVLGLVALALLAALAGSAIHFIWMAPDLLADAAFAALLSTGALPGLARTRAANWNGKLLRATWKSLASVVAVAVIGALVLGHYFPEARTLAEAWRTLR